MKLIIQIPCYNEENALPIALTALPRTISEIETVEYLIVNDGSRDKTVEVARRCGAHHIVNLTKNQGLAVGFMVGLDACLKLGADIIVNTDADNQYCGADVDVLVRPILEGRADIVIGERPIDNIEHFSWLKKKLQRLGSWVVRVASNTDIPDAPSGFRAFSREAAMKMNVVSEYTYTLETIIQAGRKNMAIISVPIRTNPSLRESRLFKSIGQYIKRSIFTILRVFVMYSPLRFFLSLGLCFFGVGFLIGLRFLVLMFVYNDSAGHVQSLLLAIALILIGVQTMILGLQADLIAANRKIIEDVQYRVRQLFYDKEDKKMGEKMGKERDCNGKTSFRRKIRL
ncbi:MAG: glycosyltransferase family 2 protein [Synergistaceae bacterium]|jgi:glycosyltransferase involved in cell wall biosynthesis|nr:glycosyltransferase family 2 protein [Synergistaceae bacterium]